MAKIWGIISTGFVFEANATHTGSYAAWSSSLRLAIRVTARLRQKRTGPARKCMLAFIHQGSRKCLVYMFRKILHLILGHDGCSMNIADLVAHEIYLRDGQRYWLFPNAEEPADVYYCLYGRTCTMKM